MADLPVFDSDLDVVVFQRPVPVMLATRAPLRVFGAVPAIKQFCQSASAVRSSKFASAATSKQPDSHYTYGGLYRMGVLNLPPGEPTRDLARAYVNDFKNCWFTALTENRPSVGCMRMYFDYDLEFDEFPTEDFWRKMEAIEKREVKRFFPDKDPTDRVFQSTVATCGVIDVSDADGTTRFKAGIHVYYPNLFVTEDMALYISTAVLSACKTQWPKPDGHWEKIIDQKVYAPTRGLRWVWQFKAKPCETCKLARTGGSGAGGAKKRGRSDWCDACENLGRTPDTTATMYAPLYRVDGNGKRDVIKPSCRQTPTVELMCECSLRAVFSMEPTPGFVLYPGAEPVPTLSVVSKRGGCSGDVSLVTHARSVPRSGHNVEVIAEGCNQFGILQNLIRRMNPIYKEVYIKQATRTPTSKSVKYTVQVRGVGSGHCMNKSGSHHSAHVYFIVTKVGIAQKCWCSCPVVRTAGVFCKEYESPPMALDAHENTYLFDYMSALDLFGVKSSFAAPHESSRPASSSGLSTLAPADGGAFTAESEASMFFKQLKTRRPTYFDAKTPGFVSTLAKAHFKNN